MAGIAAAVQQGLWDEVLDPAEVGRSIARVQARKALLAWDQPPDRRLFVRLAADGFSPQV